MEKLKNFLKNFRFSSTKTTGKEFAKYISNNRDMFDDYSVLEKKISSYNELYSQVKDFIFYIIHITSIYIDTIWEGRNQETTLI